MSNIGLLPNFAHVYFQAESGMSLIFPMVIGLPQWYSIPGNNVHDGGQICPKKYQHVEQEDKN